MRSRIIMFLLLFALATTMAQAQIAIIPNADEIMRNAKARRAAAESSTRSFTAALSTTSFVEIRPGDSKVVLMPERELIYESVGTIYQGRDIGTRVRIDAVRGTADISGPAANLVDNVRSLGGYFSIDDTKFVFLTTAIASPLSADMASFYRFEVAGRALRDGIPVYEVDLLPATDLFPVFEGKLWIAEGSYDLVALDLRPSKSTAIPFLREFHLTGRFSSVGGGSYQPESFELSGVAEVTALAFGIAEPEFAFRISTRLSDRHVNLPIPDSIRTQARQIVVRDGAERALPGFWEGRSSLSARQIEAIGESVLAARPSSSVALTALPYIDYNRVGSASLGATLGISAGPVAVGGMGGYSFGLQRPIGEVTARLKLGSGNAFQVIPRAAAFSLIDVTSTGDKSYPRIMNTLVAAGLHQDYYDFYRKDGWLAGVDVVYDPLRFTAEFERTRQFSLATASRWSLLTWNTKDFQDNPPIDDGGYQCVKADLEWGHAAPFLKITPVNDLDVRWSVSGLLGSKVDRDADFRLVEALLSLSFPVVETGYTPMMLTLLGAGGIGTATLPIQYQFRLRSSAASFGKPGGLVSPPKGFYGGTEYIALGGEFNLTDLWWRAIGLPTYKGRGVELVLAGAAARYIQRHPVGYTGTGDLWYSEVGIALSRIPLFLTDIVAGRVDARQGIGPLGQFGANFTFVVPL